MDTRTGEIKDFHPEAPPKDKHWVQLQEGMTVEIHFKNGYAPVRATISKILKRNRLIIKTKED